MPNLRALTVAQPQLSCPQAAHCVEKKLFHRARASYTTRSRDFASRRNDPIRHALFRTKARPPNSFLPRRRRPTLFRHATSRPPAVDPTQTTNLTLNRFICVLRVASWPSSLAPFHVTSCDRAITLLEPASVVAICSTTAITQLALSPLVHSPLSHTSSLVTGIVLVSREMRPIFSCLVHSISFFLSSLVLVVTIHLAVVARRILVSRRVSY